MVSKQNIYSAFAELIYAVVMADGVIKEQEQQAITAIVKNHPIGALIEQYFGASTTSPSVAQSFLHTMETCKAFGNDAEYPFLLHLVEEISKVSEGLEKEMKEGLFYDFVHGFKKRFHL